MSCAGFGQIMTYDSEYSRRTGAPSEHTITFRRVSNAKRLIERLEYDCGRFIIMEIMRLRPIFGRSRRTQNVDGGGKERFKRSPPAKWSHPARVRRSIPRACRR